MNREQAYIEYIDTLTEILKRAVCYVSDERMRSRILDVLWSQQKGAPRRVEARPAKVTTGACSVTT